MITIGAMYVTSDSPSRLASANSTQSIKLDPSYEEILLVFSYGSHISSRTYCKLHRLCDDPDLSSDIISFVPGAFGLVWCVILSPAKVLSKRIHTQLGQGSTYGVVGRDQEDYEAVQHAGSCEENIPRAQVAQTHPTRKRA